MPKHIIIALTTPVKKIMQAIAKPLVYPKNPMFFADASGTMIIRVTRMTRMSPFKYQALVKPRV